MLTMTDEISNFDDCKTEFEKMLTFERSLCEKLKLMVSRTQGQRKRLQYYFLDKMWCRGFQFV